MHAKIQQKNTNTKHKSIKTQKGKY